MELYDRIRKVAERVSSSQGQVQTEEATKTALVMPFIQALGYDVFDPGEVVPEFTADVGIKKGERVDYAVMRDGGPIMLLECKPLGSDLDHYSSQLYRYFSTTDARIGVLTDGAKYRFYSDLRDPNKMDTEPFLELDLADVDEDVVDELSLLSKGRFDIDTVLASASKLKYTNDIGRILARELAAPSDDFTRLLAKQIYDGMLTQNAMERFREIVKRSFAEFIKDAVDRRLKSALDTNRGEQKTGESEAADAADSIEERDDKIETTVEEMEAFFIVKAILRDRVDPGRVFARDVQSYFGVILDDSNRKPICRFWFNGSKKYLGVFDAEKEERRIAIDGPGGIFEHADAVLESVGHLLGDDGA